MRAGEYFINATGAFPENKTFIYTQPDGASGLTCKWFSSDTIKCQTTADGLANKLSLEIQVYY